MAWPSDLTRTKNWSTEILTDSDLEGQFDLIINYIDAMMDGTSGHAHTGSANDGKLITLTTGVTGVLPIANGGTALSSYTQGDILYADATPTLAKLGAGTSGQFLKTLGAGANPLWAGLAAGIKVKTFTHSRTTDASGSQAFTGLGATCRFLYSIAGISGDSGLTGSEVNGFASGSSDQRSLSVVNSVGTFSSSNLGYVRTNSDQGHTHAVSSFDSDGFTISYTKVNSPTATHTFIYIAIGWND